MTLGESTISFKDAADYSEARQSLLETFPEIIHIMLNETEYQEIFKSIPKRKLINPGEAPKASDFEKQPNKYRNLYTQWKDEMTAFDKESETLKKAKLARINSMPEDIKTSIRHETYGMIQMDITYLLAETDSLFNVTTASMLDMSISMLPTSCECNPISLRNATVKFRNCFLLHAKNDQAYSELDKIRMFTRILDANFAPFIREFNRKYPLISDKKFDTLAKEAAAEAEDIVVVTANRAIANLATITIANVASASATTNDNDYSYCWSHGKCRRSAKIPSTIVVPASSVIKTMLLQLL